MSNTDPMSLMVILFVLSLIPIIFVLTTSFIKIAMVCILARESLGVQSVPPNIVIYGISLILSFYVMGPVYNKSFQALTQSAETGDRSSYTALVSDFQASSVSLKQFLGKHATKDERLFFYQSLSKFWKKDVTEDIRQDDLLVLIPAFMVSEITQGFKIGFLIYLPSVIIDIIVSNILMAMGMMMMSPNTISLPIKLLLFISVDGWSRLIHMLLATYN